MNWKMDTPSVQQGAAAPKAQVAQQPRLRRNPDSTNLRQDRQRVDFYEQSNKELRNLIREAAWWKDEEGAHAELTKQVIKQAIEMKEKQLATLKAIHDMPVS